MLLEEFRRRKQRSRCLRVIEYRPFSIEGSLLMVA